MFEFCSGDETIYVRLRELPRKACYEYARSFSGPFRFKDLEIIFFSETFLYSGCAVIIKSTGLYKDFYYDFIRDRLFKYQSESGLMLIQEESGI